MARTSEETFQKRETGGLILADKVEGASVHEYYRMPPYWR